MNKFGAVPYVMSDSSITVMLNGDCHIVDISSPSFVGIRDAVRVEDWARVETLIDRTKAIKVFGKGKVEVRDGNVFYLGEPLNNALTGKMVRMMDQGFNITPLVNFLERVMKNPSHTAVEELYLFLESGHIPIDPDGYILAYKAVRHDYRDYHTGKFDNSVGTEHEMPRNAVDDNRANLCSRGFHFCSLDYARSYFHRPDGHLMIVKIDPADVVSIPLDYNNTKGRTWHYWVVGEYNVPGGSRDYGDFTDHEVYDGYYESDDEYEEDDNPLDLSDDEFEVLSELVHMGPLSKDEVMSILPYEKWNGNLTYNGLVSFNERDDQGRWFNKFVVTEKGRQYYWDN